MGDENREILFLDSQGNRKIMLELNDDEDEFLSGVQNGGRSGGNNVVVNYESQ